MQEMFLAFHNERMQDLQSFAAADFDNVNPVPATIALVAGMAGLFFVGEKARKERKARAEAAKAVSDARLQEAELDKKKVEDDREPNLIIIYGSQSGTAENLANELEAEARSYSFVPKVVDMESFDVNELASIKLVTILMATYGEGEPPNTGEAFWDWIKDEDLDEGLLKDTSFAIFGLGNRQYEFFNAMGKGVDAAMERLGGTRVVPLGLGDDDGSMDEDFAEWKSNYWKTLSEKFSESGESPPSGGEVRVKFTPKFECEFLEDETDERVDTARALEHPTDTDPSHTAFLADVVENRELRQDTSEGYTKHLEIDAKQLPYVTADNLSVVPRNSSELVAKVCERLDVDPDSVFYFKSEKSNAKNSFSKPTTVRNALTWYTDLTSLPRKTFVSSLAEYATDEYEQKGLLHLTSTAGKAEFQQWLKEGMCSYDVLLEFPSVKIPIAHFLELSPRLQVREYTISSSSKAQPERIAISYSVVNKMSPVGGPGVTTQYLAGLKAGQDKLACFVKTSTFRLPQKVDETPVIMVGPGTGVAPMRAFVQEGTHIKANGGSLAEWRLFFGSRYELRDFIYRDELTIAEESGVLTKLHTAFSRDQDEKYYVQDALRDNSSEVYPLVRDQGAHIYVCGSTQMGRSIRETFIAMIEKHDGVSTEKAQEVLRSLQDQKRYIQELWG